MLGIEVRQGIEAGFAGLLAHALRTELPLAILLVNQRLGEIFGFQVLPGSQVFRFDFLCRRFSVGVFVFVLAFQ